MKEKGEKKGESDTEIEIEMGQGEKKDVKR